MKDEKGEGTDRTGPIGLTFSLNFFIENRKIVKISPAPKHIRRRGEIENYRLRTNKLGSVTKLLKE